MTRRTAFKIGLATAVVMVAGLASALAWLKLAPRHVPSGQPPLAILEPASMPALRHALAAEEVRLLALLSPT